MIRGSFELCLPTNGGDDSRIEQGRLSSNMVWGFGKDYTSDCRANPYNPRIESNGSIAEAEVVGVLWQDVQSIHHRSIISEDLIKGLQSEGYSSYIMTGGRAPTEPVLMAVQSNKMLTCHEFWGTHEGNSENAERSVMIERHSWNLNVDIRSGRDNG